jgi:hypothetical protein
LLIHKDRFDYIIIETTGLANPGPVISSLWTDDALIGSLKLDGVVCLVDAFHITKYLNSPDVAADVRLQMCFADRIIVNKADLVTGIQVWSIISSRCLIQLVSLSQLSMMIAFLPRLTTYTQKSGKSILLQKYKRLYTAMSISISF